MSKINEQLNNGFVEDTYLDHATHLVYRNDCSECYNKAPQVEINQDGDIVLADNYDYDKDDEDYHADKDEEESNSMFGIDLEQVHNSYN